MNQVVHNNAERRAQEAWLEVHNAEVMIADLQRRLDAAILRGSLQSRSTSAIESALGEWERYREEWKARYLRYASRAYPMMEQAA